MNRTSLRRFIGAEGLQHATFVGKARRVANRVRREVIARVPPLRRAELRRRATRREHHVALLPSLTADGAAVVEALRSDGVLVTSLAALAVPNTAELQRRADHISRQLTERQHRSSASTIRATNDELAEDPAVWRWGLDENLLAIVERHLGLPPRYYGAEIRLELPDSKVVDVRQWHRDVEDDRLFKILIWINDVDVDTGPFEFVDRPRTDRATTSLSYVSGFVDERRFADHVDLDEWQRAVGPRWTAAIADTAAVFHRAKPPTAVARYSITYTYSTDSPRKTYPKTPFSPAQVEAITAGLSPRQLAALPSVIGN